MRRIAIAICLTAVGVLALPWLAAWQRERFAEELAQRSVQSTELSVANVRDMWQLGLSATRPLVELAAAQRTELAVAAQEAVSDQLAAWEVEFTSGGDIEAFAERMELLSDSIRDNAGRFHWAGQLWAKKLARQIAQHSAGLDADDAFAVLTACEQVLSLPELDRPVEAAVAYNGISSAKPLAADAAPPVVARPVEAKPLPAARPVESTPMVDAPPSPPAELSVIMPPTEPPPAMGVNPDNPLRPIEEPAVISDSASMRITAIPNATAPTPTAPVDVPSPLEMRHDQQRLRELSDRDLMALADTASRFEAAAAGQVLRRRGYSDRLLELTQQLQAMPPRQRRQALERASALPAADARRLLRWFVADADADVRLQALTLLATTGDPKLAEIARERAIEDADPRVAELATKLMQ